MNKIFIDTNILVYSIDEDSKFYTKSQELILNSNSELVTSSKNLSEFLSVVTRSSHNSLSIENALKVLNDFTDIFTIFYPSPASYSIFIKLLRKYKPLGLKIHDFEIISIGLANGISQIATFDTKDFKHIKEVDLVTI